jgi:hypothetical protein
VLKVIAAIAVVVALGVAGYALAGGDDGPGHGKSGKPAKQMKHENRGGEAREGHGPPSWAPAYGYRCKQEGNAPGSAAFKDCVQAKKQ